MSKLADFVCIMRGSHSFENRLRIRTEPPYTRLEKQCSMCHGWEDPNRSGYTIKGSGKTA